METTKNEAEILAELAPKIMGAFHDLGPQHPEDEPMTMRQYQALIILHAAGKLTIKEFCEKLNLAASTGTELANRMISLGFFEKKNDSPDKRKAVLTVTSKGLELLQRRKQALTSMFERFLAQFSREDKKEFVESFERIWWIIIRNRQ